MMWFAKGNNKKDVDRTTSKQYIANKYFDNQSIRRAMLYDIAKPKQLCRREQSGKDRILKKNA